MTEKAAVIELSSDSSAPPSPAKNDENDRIAALISKYNCGQTASTKRECISDSDETTLLLSDHDDDKNNFVGGFNKKFSPSPSPASSEDELRFSDIAERAAVFTRGIESISDSDDSTTTNTKKPINNSDLKRRNNSAAKTVEKKRKTPVDKETKKLEKIVEQRNKREEREQKKQEAMREKQLKRALSAANKNIKPNECIKFITVHIDPEILNEPYGTDILAHLRSTEAQYKVETQTISHTITWKRQTQNHQIDDDGQLLTSSEITDTDDVLILMDWKKFVEHVHANSLLTYVKSVASVYENKRFYLGIYGLEAYFKYIKAKKKKEIADASQSQKASKADRVYAEAPLVTKRGVEYALTELQLFCNCCYRMAETPQDVALIIGQFSKSVAQLPYKLEKNEKYQETDWYMAGDKKDTVGVDKDGNGLQRLWNQQLCCFPLARLETAEAIASQYPTPMTLVQAYENCTTKEDGERLLQDIPIRRAAGPIKSVRKIGPELSKKAFTFFTSTDETMFI